LERRLSAKVKKLLEKANRKLRTAERLSKMGEHDDALSRAYYEPFFTGTAKESQVVLQNAKAFLAKIRELLDKRR